MARARLRDRHQDNLRKKLQVLKAEQAVTTPAPEENTAPLAELQPQVKPEPKPGTSQEDSQSDNENEKLVHFFVNLNLLNIYNLGRLKSTPQIS